MYIYGYIKKMNNKILMKALFVQSLIAINEKQKSQLVIVIVTHYIYIQFSEHVASK